MPKMKTKKAAAKRYRVNKNGKVKIQKSGKRHILTNKSPGSKLGKRKAGFVHESDVIHVRRTLPYAF